MSNTVTKDKKLRGTENISIETGNVRTLGLAGKLEELTHEMDRYHWNILRLCEMRWRMTDTRFILVEKRTDTSMGLVWFSTS